MKIALRGTGMMGERMGGRLLDAGHDLAVYNRTRSRTAALAARGAAVADTPRAAAEGVPGETLLDAFARSEILPAWALGKLESLGGGDVRTAFLLALADKDMRLVAETATGLELPLAETVAGAYARASAAGLGDRDFSAVGATG
jgi:3-hydroxyisobutyrate dehydrogenase-like beta-hydroxyacid dehydrogenase